jgi:exodeoxyribonuclease VII small subunit
MLEPDKLTFKQAIEKLEATVAAIEKGEIALEDSIEKYAEGMALIKRCRSILADAELRVQKLQAAADGTLQPAPFDSQPDQND